MSVMKPYFALLASVAAVTVLTACGGGGTGGKDPVVVTNVGGPAANDLTIKAGENFSFAVVAESPDNAISKLSWTMQASANAPALALSNMDCASAERTDTPRQNGLVSSVWKCAVSGTTPGLVEKDAVYTFTAVGTNTKSSTGSTSSVLRVSATPSDSLIPKVEINAPTKVVGGDIKDLTCTATNRFATAGQTTAYTYAWSSSSFDGKQVDFDSRSAQKVKATFPKLPANSTMIVTCKATDAAGNVGQASEPIEITQTVPVVSITGSSTGPSTGNPGDSIALVCSATGGGANYKYSWSSMAVNGVNLSFNTTTGSVVSVTLPSVTKPTSIVATCNVTDELGATGQAFKVVDVVPLVAPPAPPASAASGT